VDNIVASWGAFLSCVLSQELQLGRGLLCPRALGLTLVVGLNVVGFG